MSVAKKILQSADTRAPYLFGKLVPRHMPSDPSTGPPSHALGRLGERLPDKRRPGTDKGRLSDWQFLRGLVDLRKIACEGYEPTPVAARNLDEPFEYHDVATPPILDLVPQQ